MPPDLQLCPGLPAGTVLPGLELGYYRAFFRVTAPIRLPAYAGSLWRGVLGHALQDVFCRTRDFKCSGCRHRRDCLYGQLMETPPNPEVALMGNQASVPHPLILRVPAPGQPKTHGPGERVPLDFALFGMANYQLRALIEGFAAIAEREFGRDRGRLVLERVERQDPNQPDGPTRPVFEAGRFFDPGEPLVPQAAPMPRRVTVHLETPLRLKSRGEPVTAGGFNFEIFLRAVVRRVSMIHTFYGKKELEANYQKLWELAKQTRFSHCQVFPYRWARRSNRQNRTLRMDGLLGRFSLDLRGNEEVWPFLSQGRHLLVGKGTIMGMGRYRLE